jgi:imidazolonepropionase-like amidohydrolase
MADAAAHASSFVLREVQVLDEAGGFSEPLDVHVEDGRVAAVRSSLVTDAPSYDFAGLWLMPGVFDCHVHIGFSSFDVGELLRQPVTEWVLETAANCRATLEAGVTFVRDCAGADAGIRDGISLGHVPGPTLQVSNVMICQTGGHGDGFLAGPGFETALFIPTVPSRPRYIADGVDEMRKTVRSVLRAGADFVKLAATGGLMSEHDDPLEPQFTLDELETAVAEARRRSKPVAAHALGGDGLENAVRAGVRSVEHGCLLTEMQAALMAERGCWLVPTLSIYKANRRWAQEGTLAPASARKSLSFRFDLGDCVRVAKEYGVRIAAGTDYIYREQHGHNLEELALLHRAGLTVEEALLAGTARGAELCGVDADYGRILPGYVFDAVVLDEDPGDLSRFAEPGVVTGVFKRGVPVVPHPRLSSGVADLALG